MKYFIYFFTLFGSFGIITSCQKGEEISVFTDFSIVTVSNFPSSYTLYYNDELLKNDIQGYHVPKGESVLKVRDTEGLLVAEVPMTIENDRTALAFINIEGNTTLLNNNLDSELEETGYVKFQIADFSNRFDTPINLLVRTYGNIGFGETQDTLLNISNNFSGEFQKVVQADNSTGIAYYVFYVLDENNEPILENGLPIAFLLDNQISWSPVTKAHSVYLSYFTLNPNQSWGEFAGFGIEGNSSAIIYYSGSTLFSK